MVKLKSINYLIKSIGELKKLDSLEIDQTINNFINKNFSLPLFNTDISNLLKYLNITYDSAIQRKIDPTKKRNIPYTGKRPIMVTKNFDREVKDRKFIYGDTSPEINLHLLLEGTGNSSDYYSSFFQFIQKFMKRELEWEKN